MKKGPLYQKIQKIKEKLQAQVAMLTDVNRKIMSDETEIKQR